jgi:hypothetical protein
LASTVTEANSASRAFNDPALNEAETTSSVIGGRGNGSLVRSPLDRRRRAAPTPTTASHAAGRERRRRSTVVASSTERTAGRSAKEECAERVVAKAMAARCVAEHEGGRRRAPFFEFWPCRSLNALAPAEGRFA